MNIVCLYSAYIRGEACLAPHKSRAAALEYQTLIHRPSAVENHVACLVAPLQLGRAYEMSSDIAE